MLTLDADPVLLEGQALARELRRTRRALSTDAARMYGDEVRHRVMSSLSGANATAVEAAAASMAPELRVLAEDLAATLHRLESLLQHPRHREVIDRELTHRAASLRVAVAARHDNAKRQRARETAQAIIGQAAASNRSLTSAERLRLEGLYTVAAAGSAWGELVTTEQRRDTVLDALSRVRLRTARQQLSAGLLRTDQMSTIISEALPALHRGEPLLLIGETGGAKTALAEHLALTEMRLQPELVSGYGDITSAQVIGAYELRAEGGATVSVFARGPMLRAMIDGHPIILDEVNAMPPEFLKRLNRILQLRPGDQFSVQEHAGEVVRIAPGFVVLATANEQTPHRYRAIDRLSAELVNRFGANSYRVHYPDSGKAYTDFPEENALLATAAVVDVAGDLPPELTVTAIERVSRAAFISQQVFAGRHGTGFGDFVSSERAVDGRPGLEESVLAPRTLVAILQKVTGSAGAISLEHALGRFVEGVMHREDRHVLSLIIEGQGFRLS